MAGVSLNYFWTLIIFIYGIAEVFFFSYFFQNKLNSLKIFKTNGYSVNNLYAFSHVLSFIFIIHIINYLTLKLPHYITISNVNFFNIYFFVFLPYFYFIIKFFFKSNFYYTSIIVILFSITYLYTMCVDYITLLLILETITTLYYFFFLKYAHLNTQTLIKYKNLISQYLWLSFFTLIFFLFNFLLWVYLYGTLNFDELSKFLQNQNVILFVLIGFFWKLGLPVFHFFKLELYQFLDFTALIFFSISSLLINTMLFIYILYILNITITFAFTPILCILLFNIIFLLQGVDKLSFFYFFAVSSINTWVFFLILSLS